MADNEGATPEDSTTATEGESENNEEEAQQWLSENVTEDDEDKPLGEAGQKAFEANKTKLKELKSQLREFKELGLTPAQIAELRNSQTDENDPERIREQARTEARQEALQERVKDKIEARAAKSFVNPEDAVMFLSGQLNDFIEDNSVDSTAIDEALESLASERPYLSAATAKRFNGTADGSARNGGSGPKQLTQDDLRAMTPDQIVEAKRAGQLTELLGRH